MRCGSHVPPRTLTLLHRRLGGEGGGGELTSRLPSMRCTITRATSVRKRGARGRRFGASSLESGALTPGLGPAGGHGVLSGTTQGPPTTWEEPLMFTPWTTRGATPGPPPGITAESGGLKVILKVTVGKRSESTSEMFQVRTSRRQVCGARRTSHRVNDCRQRLHQPTWESLTCRRCPNMLESVQTCWKESKHAGKCPNILESANTQTVSKIILIIVTQNQNIAQCYVFPKFSQLYYMNKFCVDLTVNLYFFQHFSLTHPSEKPPSMSHGGVCSYTSPWIAKGSHPSKKAAFYEHYLKLP